MSVKSLYLFPLVLHQKCRLVMYDFNETSLQATAPPSDTKGTNSDTFTFITCSLPHCHVTKQTGCG